MPTPADFFAIEIRVGTVVRALPFPEARKPMIKMEIDFGAELGLRKSSAQVTTHYTPEQLVGRQVAAVTNIGTRRVGTWDSECLVLGALPEPPKGPGMEVVLLNLDQPVPNGTRIG